MQSNTSWQWEETNYQYIQLYGWISKILCWMREATNKGVHIEWLHFSVVIATRPVVVWELGIDSKGTRESFVVMEKFSVLIVVAVYLMNIFIKTHWTLCFIWVHFIAYQLYINISIKLINKKYIAKIEKKGKEKNAFRVMPQSVH